jgi:hypothetical protein
MAAISGRPVVDPRTGVPGRGVCLAAITASLGVSASETLPWTANGARVPLEDGAPRFADVSVA